MKLIMVQMSDARWTLEAMHLPVRWLAAVEVGSFCCICRWHAIPD